MKLQCALLSVYVNHRMQVRSFCTYADHSRAIALCSAFRYEYTFPIRIIE